MQFRPVGIEGPGEELAPEAQEFGESVGPRRGCRPWRKEMLSVMVAMTRPCCFQSRLLPRYKRLFPALIGSFGPIY